MSLEAALHVSPEIITSALGDETTQVKVWGAGACGGFLA